MPHNGQQLQRACSRGATVDEWYTYRCSLREWHTCCGRSRHIHPVWSSCIWNSRTRGSNTTGPPQTVICNMTPGVRPSRRARRRQNQPPLPPPPVSGDPPTIDKTLMTDDCIDDGSRTRSAGKVDGKSGTRTADQKASSSNNANRIISPAGDGGAQSRLENCDLTDLVTDSATAVDEVRGMVSTGPAANKVSTGPSTSMDYTGPAAHSVSTGPSYNFVQACCESDSTLQTTAGPQVKVINITENDDFTLASTLVTVLGLLNGPRDVLFFSAPCTGGSPWQRLNLARNPNLVGRMRRHWALLSPPLEIF